MGSIQTIRGTRDILPEEVGYWQFCESIAATILDRAVYQEIRPPIFEQTSLFERGIGEATDVVGKEMYTFLDRSDRSLTLRPEGTAGVVRAFIENNLYASGSLQRLWYRGPMFRYERPKAGRQRQFHQIGLELIGSPDPRADVEVIAIATDILQSLGLTELKLNINSVGNIEDRANYREALVNYLTPYKNDLDSDSQDRLIRNPLRILDSKDPKTGAIIKNAPSILEYLGENSKKHFDKVQQLLKDLGISYEINPCLVRGLDYYTHTAFEIQSENLGTEATVCGGGRYDGLVKQLGGPDTPAVGWGIGMERLVLLIQQLKKISSTQGELYVVSRGEKAEALGIVIAQKLRHRGFSVETDLSGSNFGKQFKRAASSGAVACLIIGDGEVEKQTIQLKWLKTQEQLELPLTDFLNNIDTLRQQIEQHKQNTPKSEV